MSYTHSAKKSLKRILKLISVVLPTYNRASVLKTSLERLSQQKGVEFEVIVVDDGSSDGTSEISNVQFPMSNWKRLKYIHQSNSGQAVARNRGMKEAKGELILFFQDDTFAVEDDFLKKHLDAHEKHSDQNIAVLGFTTWDSALEINDYMLFLEASGWQFGYAFLKPGFVDHPDPWKFFYTSNISIKKSLFNKEKFNEKFRAYGWEDMELGYRLWKNHGMKLFYEPNAKAHHHHLIPEADLPKKMRKVGSSALKFQKLHPELSVIPTGWKRFLIWLATRIPSVTLAKWISKNLYFKIDSWREFFVGVKAQSIDK